MLLHIVCSGELLMATRVGTLDGLLGRVDLGMTRGMAGCGEGFLAAMTIAVPAGVTLGGPLRGGGRVPAIILVRVGATALKIRRSPGGTLLFRKAVVIIDRPR